MMEQAETHLTTALKVQVDTTAPNERGEIVVILRAFQDDPFEMWLTSDEARWFAGQLEAQAGLVQQLTEEEA
jgi:hypothetical protein